MSALIADYRVVYDGGGFVAGHVRERVDRRGRVSWEARQVGQEWTGGFATLDDAEAHVFAPGASMPPGYTARRG